MSEVKKYITKFNNLHDKQVTRAELERFHKKVKNIAALHPVKEKLEKLMQVVNGKPVVIKIDNPVALPVVKKKKTIRVVESSKPKRETKKSLPPVKREGSNQVTKEVQKKSEVKIKPASALAGFTSADKAPDEPKNTFRLPGEIGKFIGDMQGYKLEFVIAGETHSSKSEIGKQIADAFISKGDSVAWVDWEQGGLESIHTQQSIKRNVKPENRSKFFVSSEVPKTLDAVKELAKKFKVIFLDSGSSLKQITNAWIDELREKHPDTIWIILMQQNEKGGTRGGSAAEFDAPVVIKTYRPDHQDYKKNYAFLFKNRGNKTGVYYNIASKKILDKEPV